MPGASKNMLAFTIQGGGASDLMPGIGIGYPDNTTAAIVPRTTKADLPDEFYWVCLLDNYRPGLIIVDFIIDGSNYSTVPPKLDAALSDPEIIFVVVTKSLSLQHVPKGDFYNLLVKYGAGPELQRLNQLSTTLYPGGFKRAGYVLTGAGGKRGGTFSPPSYEASTITEPATIVAMSLMQSSGQQPYTLIDLYTVNVHIKTKKKAAPKTQSKVSRPKPKARTSKKAGAKSKR
jgi:hypothetical protein